MTSKFFIRVLLCSTFIAGSGVILQGCVFDPGGKTLFTNQEPTRKNTPTVKRVAARSNETNFASSDKGSGSGSSDSGSSGMGGGSSSSSSSSGGGASDPGWSDRRLKTDIRRLSISPGGIPIYAFRYIWGGPVFVGTMAQDLLSIRPDAVIETRSGYYMVDYSKLDVGMASLGAGTSPTTTEAVSAAVALALALGSARSRSVILAM
ncbi:tail fiber domain-containing protein [Rhizobium ruizarguesonis]|uniref:tail fiber domain-containing protein n=1 Tax=Rhizobium ruizarguesonis TaxID=2081791 RepID=UPI0010305B4F|nr:tail fiber domain-containing protein [Rhizobium ruizarguesonis]TAY64724.1 tail fiber domain-containing protein [Rhizobium ruizarguesonis]